MSSPLVRSKAYLEGQGFVCAKVEHWNPYSRTRHDLFGLFDLACLDVLHQTPGVLGVQTTSGSNVSARVKKLQASPLLSLWLACGNTAVVHGWKKVRNRWQVRVVRVTGNTTTTEDHDGDGV